MGFKLAIVDATGNVGREMLDILAERRFPADDVVALASPRSIGTEVSFGDKILKCKSLENFDFSGTDICLMSAGGTVSKEWAPKIAGQGCVVIDNSSAWRYDSDVPLIGSPKTGIEEQCPWGLCHIAKLSMKQFCWHVGLRVTFAP